MDRADKRDLKARLNTIMVQAQARLEAAHDRQDWGIYGTNCDLYELAYIMFKILSEVKTS